MVLPPRALTEADVADIRAAYDAEYTRFYDRPVPGSDVEIMSFAVTVSTVIAHAADGVGEAAASTAKASRTQLVRDTATGEVTEWAIYDRAALAPGASFAGPAIVEEDETSTLIAPGWTCRVDPRGYLELEHKDAA